jgi:hypothetical protein
MAPESAITVARIQTLLVPLGPPREGGHAFPWRASEFPLRRFCVRSRSKSTPTTMGFNQKPGVTPGLPIGLPENATTVRVEGGMTRTTDGPFVGMKEAVGGWFIVEADDLDAAIEVTARVPAARYGGAVEIRPSEVYW